MNVVPEHSPLLDALEGYADLLDEIRLIVNTRNDRRLTWEGPTDRATLCSWGRLLCKWRHSMRPDRPPHTLVVRLSNDLPKLLQQVCRVPKRLLCRERELEPLHRLREFDSTCMRWVCRQPGLSLPEKAGHRRSLLAVRRFESADTLENRVVLSLIRRSIRLCHDYLRQYGEEFKTHSRIEGVRSFLRLCRHLLHESLFLQVVPLESVPIPNYVLLHEGRYHKIWQMFLLVMRRQRRRQVLWNHRLTLLQDMLLIAGNEYLSRKVAPLARKAGARYDVVLLPHAHEGSFLRVDCAVPYWGNLKRGDKSDGYCEVISAHGNKLTATCRECIEEDVYQDRTHDFPVNLMLRSDEHWADFFMKVPGQ